MSSLRQGDNQTAAKPKSADCSAANEAPPSELLLKAVALHQGGQLDDAKSAYQSLLKDNPADSDALHYLGLIAFQRGNYSDSAGLIEQAVKLNGNIAAFHFNLGNAYKQLKQFDSAVDDTVGSAVFTGLFQSWKYFQRARQAGSGGQELPQGTRAQAGLCQSTCQSRCH